MIRCALPPKPPTRDDETPVIPRNIAFSAVEKRFLRAAIRFAEDMSEEAVLARAKQLERMVEEADHD